MLKKYFVWALPLIIAIAMTGCTCYSGGCYKDTCHSPAYNCAYKCKKVCKHSPNKYCDTSYKCCVKRCQTMQ